MGFLMRQIRTQITPSQLLERFGRPIVTPLGMYKTDTSKLGAKAKLKRSFVIERKFEKLGAEEKIYKKNYAKLGEKLW